MKNRLERDGLTYLTIIEPCNASHTKYPLIFYQRRVLNLLAHQQHLIPSFFAHSVTLISDGWTVVLKDRFSLNKPSPQTIHIEINHKESASQEP